MKTYVNYELHFKSEIEAKKFKEENYCYLDYFQFEDSRGMTFGYIDNSEIESGLKLEGNVIFVKQRYKDIFAENSYYKRYKNSDEDVEISAGIFMQKLKTGKLTEVGFYYGDDDEYDIEVKNVNAEFNGIEPLVSDDFLVMFID